MSTILDTEQIYLYLDGEGQAACSFCSLDDRAVAELDLPTPRYSSPEAITAHLLKHLAVRHEIPHGALSLEYWSQQMGKS